jgi:hypothetical protein
MQSMDQNISNINYKLKSVLSKLTLKLYEPRNNENSENVEFNMSYDLSSYIYVLVAFLELNEINYSRPAGPIVRIRKSDLDIITNISKEKYGNSNINIDNSDLYEIKRIKFYRNLEKYEKVGKVEVGWRVNLKLKDDLRWDLKEFISTNGTFTLTTNENEYILYFKKEKYMESFIDVYCKYL